MKPATDRFIYFVVRILLWTILGICYVPIAIGIAVTKLGMGRWLFRDSVHCPTCGVETPLLGLWECGSCGFRHYGFYFTRCELCGNVPRFLDCAHCSASILSPLL